MLTNSQFKTLLDFLKSEQAMAEKELAACPEGSLWQTKRNNKPCFYSVSAADGLYTRKAITNDDKALHALCRKAFLKLKTSALEKDIHILQKTMSCWNSPFTDDLLQNLPSSYKGLPKEFFLESLLEEKPSPAGNWAKDYEKSSYKTDDLRHTTSRGLMTRSKSEVLIAEKLYEHSLTFRYEPVLHIGVHTAIPDFEILRPDGSTYFWEHCGRTFDKDYMKKHYAKMQLYSAADIVPWKNLIITYDDESGNIHLGVIESEIKNRLL